MTKPKVMNDIDIKARLRSKKFWVAVMSALVLLAQQLGLDIFPSNIMDITNTVLTLFVLFGIVVDNSTPGICDSTVHQQPKEVK